MTYDDQKNDYLDNSYDFDYPDFDEDFITSDRNTAEETHTKNNSNASSNNSNAFLKIGSQVQGRNEADIPKHHFFRREKNSTKENNLNNKELLDFEKDKIIKHNIKRTVSNPFMHKEIKTSKTRDINKFQSSLNQTVKHHQSNEDKEDSNEIHVFEKKNSEQPIHRHKNINFSNTDFPLEEDNLMNSSPENTKPSSSRVETNLNELETSVGKVSERTIEPTLKNKSNKDIPIFTGKQFHKENESTHIKHFKGKDNSSKFLSTNMNMTVRKQTGDKKNVDNLDSIKKSLDIDMLKALLFKHKKSNK